MPGLQILSRISSLLGGEAELVRFVTGGYTPALRLIVACRKTTFFVKVGVTDMTAAQLRTEIDNYEVIKGSFMPQMLAYDRGGEPPIMILQDLSRSIWPPPWTPTLIDRVLEAIEEMHQSDNHPKSQDGNSEKTADPFGEVTQNWHKIAADPQDFLSTGVASLHWLNHALPTLMNAEDKNDWSGDAFCHYDLRSDNMCVARSGVKFVDWNFCCRANPKLDLGFLLPSLQFEGGPKPETILKGSPEVAATVAGFMALRAGQPKIANAPRVRTVQYQQLTTALPWAARVLDLPPPDLLT